MNKKIKAAAFLAALIMLVSVFAACGKKPAPAEPTAEPTEAVTEAPTAAPTEEPTEEPTEVPTEEPTEEIDRFAELTPGEEARFDIDGDGLADVILFTAEEQEYDTAYTISIRLGNGVEYHRDFSGACYYGVAFVTDCDPGDERCEVLVCIGSESSDYDTVALRVNADRTKVEEFEKGGSSIYDIEPLDEHGMLMFLRTDLLGTTEVLGYYTVTDEGFKPVSEEFNFVSDWLEPRKVTVEFKAHLIDENGERGDEVTVLPGDTVKPLFSDLETWVKAALSDGTVVVIDFEYVNTDTEYGYYIGGVNQDDLMEIPYAD
ncbi:MAG: PT domain-containing protein [Clostridiales bacterium]|nr:PT domain-containing protein [Clostridiales bacterium]